MCRDKAKKIVKGSLIPASPVIDGKILVDNESNIIKANKFMNIPYMIGSNSEDMMAPFMHNMTVNWCKLQDKPSYAYMFNHQLPGDKNGAWHSSDLCYLFGTINNSWRPITEDDLKLSDIMVTYLCNFAKTGNPNSD